MSEEKKPLKAKKKTGRKRAILSKERICKSIIEDKVNPYTNSIAKYYKVSWITMHKFLNENPEILELMETRKTEIIEKAEEVLMETLNDVENFERVKTAKWILGLQKDKYKEQAKEVNLDGEITIKIIDV